MAQRNERNVGLISSMRPVFEKYRYYNADMSTVVEVFVDHINAIAMRRNG